MIDNDPEEFIDINPIIDVAPIKTPNASVGEAEPPSCPPTGIMPSQEDFSGPYGFDLHFLIDPQPRGSYVYSSLLRQAFIGMSNKLMMEFKINVEPEPGFYIRALLVYTCDDFICEPVVRCAYHAIEDDPLQEAHAKGQEHICKCANFKNVGHVMRCSLADTEYCYDSSSERHSVRVPLKKLQAGTNLFQVPYSFGCKTSCPRGIQRKPLQILFTLENKEGVVFGRKGLPIKICSCPKRDKDRQEKDYLKSKSTSGRKRLAAGNLDDGQPPPARLIKVEDSNEESQNEEEKHRNISQPVTSPRPPTSSVTLDKEHYRILLCHINNLQNTVTHLCNGFNNLQNTVTHMCNSFGETSERLENLIKGLPANSKT